MTKNDEKLYRRYTVRLFPTPEQEELMWKHVHACRFVWNHMIVLQQARYELRKKSPMTRFMMSKEITLMLQQEEFGWLKEVSRSSLDTICKRLSDSYENFFNRNYKKPKLKSRKKSKATFPIRYDRSYFYDKNCFVCPSIGHIKCATNHTVEIGRDTCLLSPFILYIPASKKWILSVVIKREKQTKKLTDKSMGIDLGVKDLAVVAVGEKKLVFGNINKSKRMRLLEKKKKHIKRAIDRKYRTYNGFGTPKKGQIWKKSKNIEKYEQMLREIETKMSNIRHNYIHQITRQLVNMLPERVVMEDLNIVDMLKNKHLSKMISEQNFYFFIQCMKYKCEEYGIEFIQVDRFYPSSKLCSCCGHKNKFLKLKDREWTCPVCGERHDRDYNAAINLMNYTENKNTTDKLVTKVERKKMAQKTTIVSVA